MAEIVLTLVKPLVENAISKAISFAGAQISLAWDLEKELRELAMLLAMIPEVLKDAEKKQESNQAVRLWLQHFKDVAYDAVDVLDEYGYEVLRQKVKAQRHETKQVRSLSCLSSPTFFPLRMAEKNKKINESLDKLQKNVAWLQLIKSSEETHPTVRQYPKTDSIISKVVGRHNDVSKIVNMLSEKRSQHCLAGITIVGMGGIGKTTLAKSVCEMAKEQKSYDQVAWVCVSENFDEEIIFRQLFEYFDASASQMINYDALLLKLAEKLEKKIILLVLDDVRNDDRPKWHSFRFHLLKILKTTVNSILVTTRSNKVASIISETLSIQKHDMVKLSDDECWLIIKDIVLRSSIETSLSLNLEGTGMKIAKKCGGLPLVASVIGGTLGRKMREDKWEEILHTLDDKACILQDENQMILSILKLSFDRLSSPLKKCFSYCSIFPKGFVIEKDDLIQLWMAQGFLYESEKSLKPRKI